MMNFRLSSWMRVCPVAVAMALVALIACCPAAAQRLSGVAQPERYTLRLTPDLAAKTFAGSETIALNLTRPEKAITLNAVQIKFDRVTVESQGKTLTATVSLDPAKEQATFDFSKTLPAGPLTLKIAYTGILNSHLRGFYLSQTAHHKYAVTQFEPTDARRAFPSFDEPAMKAVFDITLVAPEGDEAISNTEIVSDKPGPEPGEHTVRFAPTPKMSTYLVAFLVGDFQCLSGASDGVPIRVCASPSQVKNGAFALSAAEFFLHYYDNYFGIKYPMPKLDLIALPDFEAGAMENFGAITFRERALLIDPRTASIGSKRLVATDVAHEMAHQWFGDMVTMNWWDNIWLNEGFATWMQSKAVAVWKPQWNTSQEVASDLNNTLDLDAQRITRTIRAKADTPGEINQMFGGITYYKAAAVLRMVENYVGQETFRRGVHAYLEAHMYGNASAADFWNAQTSVSHKPVDKIMASLVTQPGVPLLTFGPVQDGKVEVTQQRFFLNPKATGTRNLVWTLPVCLKEASGAADCQILNKAEATLRAPAAPMFYGNADATGYYRSQYDGSDYHKLVSQAETALQPQERILLLGSEWALARAGKSTIGDFLSLAAAMRVDSSAYVMETLDFELGMIDQEMVSSPQEHQLFAAWVRSTFGGQLERLGPPSATEEPGKKELRAELFDLLGSVGDDPAVIAQAKRIAVQYLQKPSSAVDPTLASAALEVAAEHGDSALFDRMQAASRMASTPQFHSDALYSLALFRNPVLARRALEYAVSGKVKNQDSALLIASELTNRATRKPAWQFVQKRWPAVKAQMTISTGEYLVAATGNFCSTALSGQIADFFAAHPVPASAETLDKAQSEIGDCVELRATQGANLQRWLQIHVPSPQAATEARAGAGNHGG